MELYQKKAVLSIPSYVCYNFSMVITFYPSTNNAQLIEASDEYQNIWKNNEQIIIDSYRSISGLSFNTEAINALVYDGRSFSHPLILRSTLSAQDKYLNLIHELGHWLLKDNKFLVQYGSNHSLEVHKQLFLILYDVLTLIVGEEKAEANVRREKKHGQHYVDAWNWALSFTKEKRAEKFNELKTMYENRKS